MFRDDLSTLVDLAQAIRRARAFRGNDREKFMADPRARSAVLMQILAVDWGVAALTPRFRIRNPKFPWRSPASQQAPLLGGHAAPHPAAIWKTARYDLPKLGAYIRPLVARSAARP